MNWEKIFSVRCKKTVEIGKLKKQLKEANDIIEEQRFKIYRLQMAIIDKYEVTE